jgi:DNA polymerase III delta prime subunit
MTTGNVEVTDLWLDKYKPTKLTHFTGNKNNIKLIKQWITDFNQKSLDFKPILLLVGDPGIGKTTLAHLILNEFKFDIIEINASKLEGKTEIHKYFDNITQQGIKVIYSKQSKIGVILDEVDGMAQNDTTMKEFLNIIDPEDTKKHKPKKVISLQGFGKSKKVSKQKQELTYEDKIIKEFDAKREAKLSDAQKFPYQYPIICTANQATDKKMKKLCRKAVTIKLDKPNKSVFSNFASKIIANENMKVDPDALELLLERSNQDFRQLVSNLQILSSCDDTITVSYVDGLIGGRNVDQSTTDIAHKLLDTKNDIEDILLMTDIERKSISNMIYHNILNTIDLNRVGKRKEKVNVLTRIMASIAEGQRYDNYYYDEADLYGLIKKVVEPILISQELKIANKQYIIEPYNIQNYRSQEKKYYSNYISYFIDKFGTFDTKTIFQMCYIILKGFSELNNIDPDSLKKCRSIVLMKQYKLIDEDISKMCKLCTLSPEISVIQNKVDTAKFRKIIRIALA